MSILSVTNLSTVQREMTLSLSNKLGYCGEKGDSVNEVAIMQGKGRINVCSLTSKSTKAIFMTWE